MDPQSDTTSKNSNTYPRCYHCGIFIKVNKDRGVQARKAGEATIWERMKCYFKKHPTENKTHFSPHGPYQKDHHICKAMQTRLFNHCKRSHGGGTQHLHTLPKKVSENAATPSDFNQNSGSQIDGESSLVASENSVQFTPNEQQEHRNSSEQHLNNEDTFADENCVQYGECENSETFNESQIYAQAEYSESTSGSETFNVFKIPSTKRLKLDKIMTITHDESRCFICPGNKTQKEYRKVIPSSAVVDVWLNMNILIPKGMRCCSEHFVNGIFDDEAKDVIQSNRIQGPALTSKEMSFWIEELTKVARRKANVLDFDNPQLCPSAYHEIVGLSKEQFDKLLDYVKEHLLKSKNRTPRNALAICLAKMKLGISQRVLGRLFGIRSQQIVSDIIHRVVYLLQCHFVPNNLGFGHKKRADLINEHNPSYVRELFDVHGNNLILIADGTYLYIQQSSNHELQNSTYSMHKHRNLVKYMMTVTPDGYIVDASGPYMADGANNDAKILQHMFQKEQGIKDFIIPADHLLLDRGFRDCIPHLNENGIKSSMPELLQNSTAKANKSGLPTTQKFPPSKPAKRNTKSSNPAQRAPTRSSIARKCKLIPDASTPLVTEPTVTLIDAPRSTKAFTTAEANRSRKVTLCRFAVESINGRVKKWSFLDNVIPNSYLPILGAIFEIACALTNKFGKPVFVESQKHQTILKKVNERINMSNELQQTIMQLGYKSVSHWQKSSAEYLIDFPKLTVEDLWEITLGGYQIKNAANYTVRHKKGTGLYDLLLHKEREDIVRVKLQSRFRRAINHNVYIEYDNSKSGADQICGYFCQCQQGARVLGACSHVTAAIWYLGYGRHLPFQKEKPNYCLNLLDAAERQEAMKSFAVVAEGEELNPEGVAVGQEAVDEYMGGVININ